MTGRRAVLGSRRARVVAEVALAIWCVAYAALLLHRVGALARSESWIVWHEARVAGLRPLLPPGTTVGYLGDRERTFQSVIAFPLTQYAVAPALLEDTPERPLVVGNFLAGRPDAEDLARLHLQPERDLGRGVVLLRRRAP